ncbi:MAG: 1,2-phenylacetyl-CoA epoxidase subunit PaaC [Lysobacterales bacterium]
MEARQKALFDYCIALGDDSLTLGHRLSEWCSNGPFLEEDLALTNVALDFIGRARMFYAYAAEVEGRSRGEDDFAFLRDCREYRNLLINELPNGDFAFTMARQLMVDAFDMAFFEKLSGSNDPNLAAIAAKAIKESRYHLRRSEDWIKRLGDGTEESHERTQKAFDELWGYAAEMFQMADDEKRLADAGIAVDRAALKPAWVTTVHGVLKQATLEIPSDDWAIGGGREGIHTEHLGYLLAELQYLQRAYPGQRW